MIEGITPSPPAAKAARPTRTRLVISALLFVSVVINYLDRANLSIAAPLLGKQLAIDSVRMGLVLSAFGWSYVFCQIPGGWLVDRTHPRKLYATLIALWSVATALLGFSTGLAMLFVLRLAIGALEAPSYPINNRVVTTWFPEHERATAIGFYTSGQFVGLAFLTPALVYLQVHFGWRSIFISVGLAGIVWAVVWYTVYRGPLTYRGANPAEIELIRRGGGLVDLSEQNPAMAKRCSIAGTLRKCWAVRSCGESTWASMPSIPPCGSSSPGFRRTWFSTAASASSRRAGSPHSRSWEHSAGCFAPAWSRIFWRGGAAR